MNDLYLEALANQLEKTDSIIFINDGEYIHIYGREDGNDWGFYVYESMDTCESLDGGVFDGTAKEVILSSIEN